MNRNHWSSIFALTFLIISVMIAQFLPAGVLTPMAQGLNISEGMAGQTVSLTSLIAVITSLFISVVTRRWNRKSVLVTLSFLQCSLALSRG
tara:strand:- start:266 stop:538 length:273 start_codon:yes stop_codon:yes gene_type:complete